MFVVRVCSVCVCVLCVISGKCVVLHATQTTFVVPLLFLDFGFVYYDDVMIAG